MAANEQLLLIGLDGYSPDFAERLMDRGLLPCLSRIRARSARFILEHGAAKRTGLAFEHFSSGLSPLAGNRWSAIYFDKQRYRAWQEDARFEPFTRHLAGRTVVFDVPYFNLAADPRAGGVVSWGAHDPGTPPAGQPDGLLEELLRQFGPYPAPEWIYGFAWPSVTKCKEMGRQLRIAVEQRARIIEWLLDERLSGWDVGIAVISELHSASEGLWHGVDPLHPLHHLPSAEVAADAMTEVYQAVDKLIGDLQARFPGATLMLFAMHGMGSNESDVASMALLPELLLRRYGGRSMLKPKPEWLAAEDGIPLLRDDQHWHIPIANQGGVRRLRSGLIRTVKPYVRHLLHRHSIALPHSARGPRLDWMPAMHYRAQWPRLPAFALPSFYDGRIRVNLRGRERHGLVAAEDYRTFTSQLAAFLQACTDPRTGRPAVREIEFSDRADPAELEPSEADLVVVWDGAALALEHPDTGVIGPLPYRRPGGHTGEQGMSYICGAGITAGDYGTHSAFDLVPTVFALRDQRWPPHLSGTSLPFGRTAMGV